MAEGVTTVDCCSSPTLVAIRCLFENNWRGIGTKRCKCCGQRWLHEWSEIAMNSDWDEVRSDTFAPLTPEEEASLPQSPTENDLAFLSDRTVLATAFHGQLQKRKGWPR